MADADAFPELSSVPVTPSAITGDIVLRTAYDATTRLYTTTFSLDGGTTFQSPFGTLSAAPTATGPVLTQLIADPVEATAAVPILAPAGRLALLLVLSALAVVTRAAGHSSRRPRHGSCVASS